MKNADTRTAPPANVDEYLAALPPDQRAALESLRGVIRATVPDAAEVISYQIPVYKYKGRPLVSFGAAKKHCAFYIMSPDVANEHATDLQPYDASGATVRFTPDSPLPTELVTKLIVARIGEVEKAPSR